LPSRALGTGCGGAGGVGFQVLVDGVADLPLQRAQRLFGPGSADDSDARYTKTWL